MTAVEQEVACPKCGGRMWDNRPSKKNPKAPDFKCRDRSCDGVVWPPKHGGAPRAAASSARQPVSMGGRLPYEDELPVDEEEMPHRETGAPPTHGNVLPAIATEYIECLHQAQRIAAGARLDTIPGDVAGAVTAIAATLFIERNKRTPR